MSEVLWNSLNVLVADDSRTVRQFLIDALNQSPDPIDIEQAEDGPSCLRHLTSGDFDLAFVDVNMPLMDGLTAVAKARALGIGTFTAMMSTASDADRLKSARRIHAYEYLRKPFDTGDVLTVLGNFRRFRTTSRVLVVDDSKVVRSVVRKVLDLSFLTADVREAADGEAALELLAAESFDIVFLDINMPGISGIEVLTELRQQNPKVAVVLITAHKDTVITDQMMTLNIHQILYKPFYPRDVDRLLHRIFGLREPELIASDTGGD